MSHVTGNANVRAAAMGFAHSGLLLNFFTAIASFPNNWLYQIGKGPLSEIRRRSFEPELQPFTKTYPWHEVARLIARKIGINSLVKHETGAFSIDKVYGSFDRFVASQVERTVKNRIKAVYCYEDGALQTFRVAKRNHIQCLYDLPIGYWRTAQSILDEEKKRWPEWSSTLVSARNSTCKLERKDLEIQSSDQIFVASSFTKKTLNDYPGALSPVHVIPYGFPPVAEEKDYSGISHRPLKLLFVGGLSQRKGIADVFTVADRLGKHVKLTIVGNRVTNDCRPLENALSKAHYIPTLPHAQILQLMREHDVLVFPSNFEGFGLVITEAMSQGTPVITTFNTAGADLIKHNVDGWLINAGSTEDLQKAIENLLNNPESIASNGLGARSTALLRPWSLYGEELSQRVIEIID